MKSLLLLFIVAVSIIKVTAGEVIPPELIGAWRTKTSEGEEFLLCLRTDGLAFMGNSIGAAGLATYDPKNLTLTVSLRHDETGAEVAKIVLLYDPKALTLISVKLISYYDPMNPLPKPIERNPNLTFTRQSQQLPEFVKSLDLQKILHPSK